MTCTPRWNLFQRLTLIGLALSSMAYATAPANIVPLESWVNPFDVASARRSIDYQWETRNKKRYNVCAFIPTSETSYWFAVNYGLVKKAREMNVSLKVFHTGEGNFSDQNKQKAIVQKCIDHDPVGIIVNDTFEKALTKLVDSFPNPVSVIAVGKNLLSQKVDASSSASFNDVGQQLAKYMNQRHVLDEIRQTVMFPGDRNMQYVNAFVEGFTPQLNSNKFHLRDTIYTSDSYLEIKSAMTRYLNSNLDTSIIIGSAKVAQAAVEVLKEMSLSDDIQIVSYELSAQIYRDIKRGNITAAITNPPVVQGFLAIDMAVKLAQKKLDKNHVSPQTTLLDEENLSQFDITQVFAPYGYRETLEVN